MKDHLGTLRDARDLFARFWDTIGTQVFCAGLGVVSGILLPRLLGPQGRGELAAVTLWPITLVFLANMGMDRAAVFFAGRQRDNVSPIASTCLLVATVQCLVVFLVGLVVIPIVLRHYGPVAVRLGMFFLLCAPGIQATNLQASLLLGSLKTKPYNMSRTIASAVYSLGVVGFFLLRIPSVSGIALLQLVGYILSGWAATRFVRRVLKPSWRWEPGITKAMLKYGATTQAGEIGNFMNQRLDQLLISLLLPGAQLGIYVAAVAFADGLLIVPRAIGAVTLATGANCKATAEALRSGKRSLLLTTLALAPTSIGLWFLGPYIIPHLFGGSFGPSVGPCRVLIFGNCAMGLSTVLGEVARSVNRPEIPSYGQFAGLAVTVGLLAVLLKPYGIMGAAIASTAAYTTTMLFVLGCLVFRVAPTVNYERGIQDA